MNPDWKHTVHCIGDLHAGAITRARMEALSRDIERLGPPALHLQVGDATEGGKEHEDGLAREFLDDLPGQWVSALGNHDILHNDRTVADWASAYDQSSQNFTVELDFVRVIVIGPDRNEPGRRAGRLSGATLSFLERELESTETDCWVVCHWPLLRTVMGDPRLHFTSAMEAFHAKPDAGIRKLLARHRNAKVWISGHTHSPLSAPGLIKRTRLAPKRSIVGCERLSPGRDRQAAGPARAALLALPHPSARVPRGALPGPPGRGVASAARAPGRRAGGLSRKKPAPDPFQAVCDRVCRLASSWPSSP